MTACRSRTPTTVTATATHRPAVEQQAPIPPAHHHPQTPAVMMIQAGPTTGPAREGGAALIRTAEIVIADELRGLIGDILATCSKRRVAENAVTH